METTVKVLIHDKVDEIQKFSSKTDAKEFLRKLTPVIKLIYNFDSIEKESDTRFAAIKDGIKTEIKILD